MPFQSAEFVNWFRSVAPYINAFRGETFVIAFGGAVGADGKFVELTHDFNLLAALVSLLLPVLGAHIPAWYVMALNGLGVGIGVYLGRRCTGMQRG